MRIGVVADLIRANGAGVMALSAARMLSDAGYEVVLLAGALDVEVQQQLNTQLVAAVSFTQDQAALANSVTETEHRYLLGTFRRWFDEQLHRLQPDVLYVHNCGRVFDQLDLARLSQRLPVMHTMHDEWFYTDAHYTFTDSTGEVVRTYEPRNGEELLPHDYSGLFDVPHNIGTFLGVGPSSWLTERAKRVFPTLDVVHIPNAVDADRFALQDRAAARTALGLPDAWPIVLFVGNPTQVRKGFDRVEAGCRAMHKATGIDPVRLVVGGNGSVLTNGLEDELGEGPLLAQVRVPTSNPLRDLGIAGPALVVADIDNAKMPALYGAANVVVHPSRIDNLPTVPIEAGLCGTRCLASDVGGTRETIADVDDLFSRTADATELGARIAAAVQSSAGETAVERVGRREAQLARFALADHQAAIIAALEGLCGQGAARG